VLRLAELPCLLPVAPTWMALIVHSSSLAASHDVEALSVDCETKWRQCFRRHHMHHMQPSAVLLKMPVHAKSQSAIPVLKVLLLKAVQLEVVAVAANAAAAAVGDLAGHSMPAIVAIVAAGSAVAVHVGDVVAVVVAVAVGAAEHSMSATDCGNLPAAGRMHFSERSTVAIAQRSPGQPLLLVYPPGAPLKVGVAVLRVA